MSQRINLADPTFEPTDEQLIELSHEAFAAVPEKNRLLLEKMRRDIAAAREVALHDLHLHLDSK